MAACVAGMYSGVYKRARVVPINIVNNENGGTVSGVMKAMLAMFNDVMAYRVEKGVLSMSFGIEPTYLELGLDDEYTIPKLQERDPFRELLNMASKFNIVVVMSAGDDATADLSSTYPQMLGGAGTSHIVVGAAGRDGSRLLEPTLGPNFGSTYLDAGGTDILTVYAIGEQLMLPIPINDFAWGLVSGSSAAAATVAGLVAYYLALGVVQPGGAKEYLKQDGIRLKGLQWPLDDNPVVHPRVGLSANMIACTEDPNDPQTAAPYDEDPPEALIGHGNILYELQSTSDLTVS